MVQVEILLSAWRNINCGLLREVSSLITALFQRMSAVICRPSVTSTVFQRQTDGQRAAHGRGIHERPEYDVGRSALRVLALPVPLRGVQG